MNLAGIKTVLAQALAQITDLRFAVAKYDRSIDAFIVQNTVEQLLLGLRCDVNDRLINRCVRRCRP